MGSIERASVRAAVLGMLLIVTGGCSVYMAIKQAKERDWSIFAPGTPRTQVIEALGTPATHQENGQLVDFFTFLRGDQRDTRFPRAMAHSVANVMTVGLWELVASPVEVARDRDFSTVKVFYDAQSRVIRHEPIRIEEELTSPVNEVMEQ